MNRRLHMLIVIVTATMAGVAAAFHAGTLLSAPVHRAVGPPPADLEAIEVDFGGVRGWFVPASHRKACIVLMHGIRADRRSMLQRAYFLRDAGYSTLLFDFQAHGESAGERITFGYLEARNAHAAVALLRDRFDCGRVAAIGQSLGGAAALLGSEPLPVDALILESVYATFQDAVANRLEIRLGTPGRWLAPLLTLQLVPRLGISADRLAPVGRMGEYSGPVLIVAGTKDRHARIEEARRLADAAGGPVTLWAVDGAGHVDLHAYAPSTYEQRVLEFLARHIGARTDVPPG